MTQFGSCEWCGKKTGHYFDKFWLCQPSCRQPWTRIEPISMSQIFARPENRMRAILDAILGKIPALLRGTYGPTVGRCLDMAYIEGALDALKSVGVEVKDDEVLKKLLAKQV